MANITGTAANEIIRPGFVSPTVVGGPPTMVHDLIQSLGGNDIVEGDGGNDSAFLGAGNDRFIWNVGDGEDLIHGGAGFDTVTFHGTGGFEPFLIGSGGGGDAQLALGMTGIATLKFVEQIVVHGRGGADTYLSFGLDGTPVERVIFDLSVGGAADGATDHMQIDGETASEVITLTETGSQIKVDGLSADHLIRHFDASGDTLRIKGYGGNDRIDASGLSAKVGLTIEGGNGFDTLIGGAGGDQIMGDDGSDKVRGRLGADQLDGGNGDDEMTGGGGGDHFNFTALLANTGIDTITDFQVGIDLIGVSNTVYGAAGPTIDAGEVRLGSAAVDADDFFLYSNATGFLRFDADANGGGAAVLIAILQNNLGLTETSFEVLV